MDEDLQFDQPVVKIMRQPSHIMNTAALPAFVRYGLLFLILGVFGVLVPSDVGSGVSFDATIDGTEVLLNLELVSLFTSIKELWNSNSEYLAILIVVFSIAWPYIKLLLSIVCWVTPWKSKDVHQREMVVAILDVLAKWCLYDTFVLVIMMGTLRINANPADFGLGPLIAAVGGDPDKMTLRTWLTPKWGFYGFFAAALLSLVVSHLLIFFQRKVMFAKKYDGLETDEDRNNKPLKICCDIPKMTTQSLLAFVLVLVVLLVSGFCIDIMRFTYKSATGDEAIDYSLLSLGLKITDASLPTSGKGGPMFMVIMYISMSLVIPLLNMAFFLGLYLYPMNKDKQRTVFLCAEITFAWATCGPLIFALFTSVGQVPLFANDVIGQNCVSDGCLQVEGEIMWTIVLYLLGTIGHGVMAYYLMYKAHGELYRRTD